MQQICYRVLPLCIVLGSTIKRASFQLENTSLSQLVYLSVVFILELAVLVKGRIYNIVTLTNFGKKKSCQQNIIRSFEKVLYTDHSGTILVGISVILIEDHVFQPPLHHLMKCSGGSSGWIRDNPSFLRTQPMESPLYDCFTQLNNCLFLNK